MAIHSGAPSPARCTFSVHYLEKESTYKKSPLLQFYSFLKDESDSVLVSSKFHCLLTPKAPLTPVSLKHPSIPQHPSTLLHKYHTLVLFFIDTTRILVCPSKIEGNDAIASPPFLFICAFLGKVQSEGKVHRVLTRSIPAPQVLAGS